MTSFAGSIAFIGILYPANQLHGNDDTLNPTTPDTFAGITVIGIFYPANQLHGNDDTLHLPWYGITMKRWLRGEHGIQIFGWGCLVSRVGHFGGPGAPRDVQPVDPSGPCLFPLPVF
jgi:hypothetical protein